MTYLESIGDGSNRDRKEAVWGENVQGDFQRDDQEVSHLKLNNMAV